MLPIRLIVDRQGFENSVTVIVSENQTASSLNNRLELTSADELLVTNSEHTEERTDRQTLKQTDTYTGT